MLTCYQFKDMNVLQHGQDVNRWYNDLIGAQSLDWRKPEWLDKALAATANIDPEIIRLYQIYHDCGKPFCRIVDEDGKQHFPNHAEVSYQTWLKHSDGSDMSLHIARLIRKDMDCHTAKGEESIKAFIEDKDAHILLLTGLCELHSNAQMFGGIESTSFKIKFKQLDKIGRKLYN
jgi:hypothetical protein